MAPREEVSSGDHRSTGLPPSFGSSRDDHASPCSLRRRSAREIQWRGEPECVAPVRKWRTFAIACGDQSLQSRTSAGWPSPFGSAEARHRAGLCFGGELSSPSFISRRRRNVRQPASFHTRLTSPSRPSRVSSGSRSTRYIDFQNSVSGQRRGCIVRTNSPPDFRSSFPEGSEHSPVRRVPELVRLQRPVIDRVPRGGHHVTLDNSGCGDPR